ncbi:MAG: ABC transporter ATP-binding protein [Albidovulum sp.]|uniref:ABC transporter ATP-binding protein n=1 Tax=Albidovulum sp. TaxID=1872424 RepID=UPI003CA026E3
MTSLLKLENCKVRYGAVEAVRGINLEIRKGEIVALLGANGAGKSSTMNAIAGLTPVAEGKVWFEGRDITDLDPEEIPISGLTLSPEGRRVFGTLSVDDNLRMGAYAIRDKASIQTARERVFDLFPILAERRNQYAGTLSGGQQQMLAIGRALMCNPRLLLLDEPSLGLAPLIVEQVFVLIEKLRDEGSTIFLVEQNVTGALQIADRAYMMASGLIRSEGTAEEMRTGDMAASYLVGH